MNKKEKMEFQGPFTDIREAEPRNTPGEFLYGLFYTLFKRKVLAFLVFCFTFAGIIFGTYLVTPLWKGTAKIRVQLNPKQQLTLFQGVTTPGAEIAGVNPANDVIQIAGSRALAEEIVRKFNLEEEERKRSEAPEETRDIILWNIFHVLVDQPVGFLQSVGLLRKTPDNYFAKAVKDVQEDLEDIELEEDTTVVDVSVWGESPKRATEMANTLVGLILEKNLEMSREPVEQMIQATQNQVQTAEADFQGAAARLRGFKEKSGIVSYDDEARAMIERLDRYETDVKSLESRLSSLRIEKQPDHPEVRNLEAQIEAYRKVSIPSIQSRLASFPRQEVELARLSQDLKVKEDLYGMLKGKLLDLEVLKGSSLGALDLKVVDPARVYEYVHPDWPRWVINIPLGFIASAMTALFFVFFLEYWDNSFKSVREVEERTPLHALGAIPFMGYFQRKKLTRSLNLPAAVTAELVPVEQPPARNLPRFVTPYDVIANAMFVKNEVPLGKVFLITSPGRQEGKSFLTAILAQTLNRRGKRVLLIDTNLRNPEMERLFLVRGEKGLNNLYEEGVDLSRIVTHAGSLDIVLPGDILGLRVDPFDLLCGTHFGTFLAEMRGAYDFIFLDSPAIKAYKDALVMAPLVDGVILVAEADRTQEKALWMAKEKIEGVGGTLKGVVLNKQVHYVPEFLRSVLN